MLVLFRCKNFRSFRDEVMLSMQATTGDEYRDFNTFDVDDRLFPKGENVLLKSAVVYGPNASGKSNLLKGLLYMQQAVLLSATIGFGIIRSNETFALCTECSQSPSEYEVEFIHAGTLYRYAIEIVSGIVKKETLHRKSERMTPVYERHGSVLSITGVDASATAFIKIPEQSLFVSIAQNFGLPPNVATAIQDVLTWFNRLLIVFEDTVNSFRIYELKEKYLQEAIRIMQVADIGIRDFSVVKEKIQSSPAFPVETLQNINFPPFATEQVISGPAGMEKIDIKTRFDVRDGDGRITGQKEIYIDRNKHFHSEGTRRLMYYLGWILLSLDEGRVILMDELDTKFHFLLADYILKMYNSISKNPHNAQLVSTAHNLMLMDDSIRRDQIYFASKDSAGVSVVTVLSDFRHVRKNDLFSKKYLLGFYAGIPDMTEEG